MQDNTDCRLVLERILQNIHNIQELLQTTTKESIEAIIRECG